MPEFVPILLDAHNPGPMTGSGNHTYLLLGQGGDAALVDAGVGHPRHLDSLDRELQDRQAALTRVLATHGHGDHVAGAPVLARHYPLASFAKFPWPEEDSRYDVAWHTLAEGDAIAAGGTTLTVLHTPGHSPDHVAFWHEATRTVFTGDLVIGSGSVMIHSSRGGSLIQYLASLERLIRLRPTTLLPAHGPVIDDPIAVLTWSIEHRRMREQQIVQALHEGRTTIAAITESVYDGLDPAFLAAATENVRAHLEKLKAERRAFCEHEHWRI
jgi:glyoxylase-like metal-dependent hydrolase (beta-lactamase superfamily II)